MRLMVFLSENQDYDSHFFNKKNLLHRNNTKRTNRAVSAGLSTGVAYDKVLDLNFIVSCLAAIFVYVLCPC